MVHRREGFSASSRLYVYGGRCRPESGRLRRDEGTFRSKLCPDVGSRRRSAGKFRCQSAREILRRASDRTINAVWAFSHPRRCCSQCRSTQLSNFACAEARGPRNSDRVIPGSLFHHWKCRLGSGGGGQLAIPAVARYPHPFPHLAAAEKKAVAPQKSAGNEP